MNLTIEEQRAAKKVMDITHNPKTGCAYPDKEARARKHLPGLKMRIVDGFVVAQWNDERGRGPCALKTPIPKGHEGESRSSRIDRGVDLVLSAALQHALM